MPPFIIKEEKRTAFKRWLWVRFSWCVDVTIVGFAFAIAFNLMAGVSA
ncbi:hypothetical protein EZMO1_2537 [Endozoicomonas montiporae CL-33]|uniref:Uncharacterized protein n=1 Tax=Endozoicomonas montiporae CL-33 TaxID=570277 RepID=A0A142BCZ0_9GAMM|nr:hypothetical protein EZMO1_2537 [Endozoicomonas montiporae CL-33]